MEAAGQSQTGTGWTWEGHHMDGWQSVNENDANNQSGSISPMDLRLLSEAAN